MTLMEERWKVALHEAAHAVTARAVNSWNCTASALIRADGRAGSATLPDGLTPFAEAVATAAGEHGASLPFDPPSRRRRPSMPPAETAEGIRARAVRWAESETAENSFRQAMANGTDPEAVAAYCVSLHPDDPDEWRDAFNRVHDEAKRLTWELRDTIRAVAVRLFHSGRVELRGDPEHDGIFAAGAVAGGATMPE